MLQESIRVAIVVDGAPRCLFQAQLSKHNDLYIFLKHAEHFGNGEGPLMRTQKYSVHPSRMPEHNLIKQTIATELEEGSTVHFTKALKLNNNFAELYTRCAPSLAYDRYIVSDGSIVSIGEYHPACYTLLYTVLVSNRERELAVPHTAEEDFNVTSVALGPYRVSVLSCFYPVPSPEQGWLCHYTTLDTRNETDETFRQLVDPLQDGRSDEEACAMFSTRLMLSQLVDHVSNLTSGLEPIFQVGKLSKWGTRHSPGYNHLLRDLIGIGTIG